MTHTITHASPQGHNLRAQPTTAATVVGKVAAGDAIGILATSEDWVHVSKLDSSTRGWLKLIAPLRLALMPSPPPADLTPLYIAPAPEIMVTAEERRRLAYLFQALASTIQPK